RAQGRLPEGWRETLRTLRRRAAEAAPERPSIEVAADTLAALADTIPDLFSGAPDLEGPTRHKQALAAFTAENRAGRYLHYGVREHAMGAMMNGMAAHRGLVPVGATYLVFSDYLRPALRMAALMELPVVTVYSHDSIGIGRNGPTHQPVEFLASLRAMPNMLVLRPADAVETVEAWELALANRHGPTSLICARQPLPPLRRGHSDGHQEENLSARGAYMLAEASDGRARATLIGTGSEVAVALAARERLQREGIPTRVVSMPSFELFAAQPEAYRAEVIPAGTVRVAVEAAVRLGWDRWIGEGGGFVGMAGFGASGPGEDLFRHFGITPDAVVREVKARL
ncbi:MAG: transketolase, partial [Methylobacterium sp.]|uniref:transketolase-like TK C-terminal-containing protein n=1 Tax=Methylobacterium sp. TaxID=409 RepID=UPI00258A8134